MDARNARICGYYDEGHSIAACAKHFVLSRQRVQQILKKGGAWRPHEPSGRTEHLGVTVKEETKTALERKAAEMDPPTSVSKLASDALDALVAPKG